MDNFGGCLYIFDKLGNKRFSIMLAADYMHQQESTMSEEGSDTSVMSHKSLDI